MDETKNRCFTSVSLFNLITEREREREQKLWTLITHGRTQWPFLQPGYLWHCCCELKIEKEREKMSTFIITNHFELEQHTHHATIIAHPTDFAAASSRRTTIAILLVASLTANCWNIIFTHEEKSEKWNCQNTKHKLHTFVTEKPSEAGKTQALHWRIACTTNAAWQPLTIGTGLARPSDATLNRKMGKSNSDLTLIACAKVAAFTSQPFGVSQYPWAALQPLRQIAKETTCHIVRELQKVWKVNNTKKKVNLRSWQKIPLQPSLHKHSNACRPVQVPCWQPGSVMHLLQLEPVKPSLHRHSPGRVQ